MADDWLVVGRITGCYGIRGWVKIHSFTDPQENFLGFGQWMLRRRDGVERGSFAGEQRRHQVHEVRIVVDWIEPDEVAHDLVGVRRAVAPPASAASPAGRARWFTETSRAHHSGAR